MRFAVFLALIGAVTCADVENHHLLKEDNEQLSKMVVSALAGAPPHVINEPKHSAKDQEGASQIT